MSRLRSESKVDLIGDEADDFSDPKLPTLRQVMCIFFYHMRLSHDVKAAARTCLQKVLVLWNKTKLARIKDFRAIEKILCAYQEWRGLRRHANDRAPSDALNERKRIFVEKFDNLFDICKQDVVMELEKQEKQANSLRNATEAKLWEEEKLFLIDQRGPRCFSLGGIDRKYKCQELRKAKKQDKKQKRIEELNRKREKDVTKRQIANEFVQLVTDESNDEKSNEDRSPFASPGRKKRGRCDVITPEVIEAIDAAQVSSTSASRILAAVASASGVLVQNSNINRRTVQRKREKLRDSAAINIKNSFEPDSVLTVHWDGKIVPFLTRKAMQDRQAIIVIGINTSQLLGTPAVPNGTSKEICVAVTQHLEQWKIVNNVKAMCFDTTSVNTGFKNGAAVQIERELGKDLIWLPCRHHIFERVLEDVFHEVMGPSSGPDVPLFKEFQKNWMNLDHSEFVTFQSSRASKNVLNPCADTVIHFAESMIQNGQTRRDNLELLELIIIFLGGVLPAGVKFMPPGPMHSARSMAKAIYALKMCLFRKQLGLAQKTAAGLLQIAVFVVKIYVQAWFSAPEPVSAPDLEFLKRLLDYENINRSVAALKRFTFHLWYLSEDLMGLAVFDEHLSPEERSNLVSGILTTQGEDEPPKKRDVQLRDVPGMLLGDLATKNAMNFFRILGINTQFLALPVVEWAANAHYQNGKQIATHLYVVNDHAERGVKLMADFNKSITTKEDSFQNLLATVQAHRKSLPDDKKTTLIKKYDC